MHSPALPQLCFGKVSHKRLRPAPHAFKYGIYFMRLPLRAMAQQDFPTKLISRNRFNLLSFLDSDHGDGRQPLTDWIDGVLRAHDIDDATGEIWLQTFPRVLGYVFNPVSFWFCHRANGTLRAILCVVTNTFGERHSYLLDTTLAGLQGELQATKIFHVSPFCEVQGNYRFRFWHTEGAVQNHVADIDYEDHGGPLIQTNIWGTAHDLSDRSVARAFFHYPLMTIGVIVKIHWQALQLWRKRVPFFKKPKPPISKVSR